MYLAQLVENSFSEAGHPNGSLIALYVIARSRAERGIIVKLAGKLSPGPDHGPVDDQLENDPQLPFGHLNFHFREGQQAPLITPATCGTYTTQAALTPFSEPGSTLNDTASFSDHLRLGWRRVSCGSATAVRAADNVADVEQSRGCVQPALGAVDARRRGLGDSVLLDDPAHGRDRQSDRRSVLSRGGHRTARRKTGAAEENEPSCPAGSLIGHSLVGTGVGVGLDYVPGALYFAGPFHGKPYSVLSVTSATIGPFDLGTVVIRFGLHIDPYTAQVSSIRGARNRYRRSSTGSSHTCATSTSRSTGPPSP